MEAKMDGYVEALCREIEASDLKGPLTTVYFGGGTPSLLPPRDLERILAALKAKAGLELSAEISMEANPETVDGERLAAYRRLGVNRLSFGAQAVQKDILKKLGRGHEWDRVETAFAQARAAGFTNINLDLMFGLPHQTLEHFRDSLERTFALSPEHLSLYALQVEEGTPLAKLVAEGLPLPSEDLVADEYALAQGFLTARGFQQYEVSNFAKSGHRCRHNGNIWRGEDYWGFGLSAVGTVGHLRHSHGEDLGDYIRRSGQGPLQYEELSPRTLEWERLMLGLRTDEGVAASQLEPYAGTERFRRILQEGLLVQEGDRYRVPPRGFFVLNGILGSLAA
jgi:oxygen-independent coproporphyrinogen-3 oxidase